MRPPSDCCFIFQASPKLSYQASKGIPACHHANRTRGQLDAKKALENAPLAKSIGIAIIAITNAKTISANAQKVECTATAILNSATDGTINYSFTNDPSLGRGKYSSVPTLSAAIMISC